MTEGLDWRGLMRAGLLGLGLTPEAFWRLTPAELTLMLGIETGAAPLSRARLDELVRAFPDRPGGPSRKGPKGDKHDEHSGHDRAGRGT